MPPIQNTCTLGLSIRLDKKHDRYRPGDTIIGWVYRTSPVVCPDAAVKVSLHGATRTRMRSGVRWADTYQGSFTIIEGEKNRQELFRGPLHIGPDQSRQEWRFAFTLPTHIDLSWFANSKHSREFFMPASGGSVGVEPLPASFQKLEDGEYNEGIVEYYLRASLELRSKDHPDALDALLPIRILPSLPEKMPSFEDSLQLNREPVPFHVRNFTLGSKPHLSKSQKMKNLLKSSSASKSTHEIHTWVPSVLQINDPRPMGFLLHVTPTGENAPELIEKLAPTVRLKRVEVQIESLTGIKAETTYGSIDDGWKSNKDLTKNISPSFFSDIVIPSTEDLPPIDLGQMMDIHLPSPNMPDALSPSFSICNIKVEHTIHWQADYEIAGRACKTRGSQSLLVLPSADACHQPAESQEGSGAQLPPYQDSAATAAPEYTEE
uniref:Arrestin-like N-terminal domain-containing protein n=1 Tax=Bionectria ochroleuca TaxID=29856 RepID=A0A8H7TQ97_BIOOC